MSKPFFWSTPFRYMRWAARERPAYFYSIVIGLIGPVMVVTVPSIRHNLGDKPRPPIPQSYPSKCTFTGHYTSIRYHSNWLQYLGANDMLQYPQDREGYLLATTIHDHEHTGENWK